MATLSTSGAVTNLLNVTSSVFESADIISADCFISTFDAAYSDIVYGWFDAFTLTNGFIDGIPFHTPWNVRPFGQRDR